MILRWYWWRISAWSEIAALAVSAVVGSSLYIFNVIPGDDPNATAKRLLITVVATTVAWLVVTLVLKPESDETLIRFYERVRPSSFGWRRIARLAKPSELEQDSLGLALIDWIAALGLVYGTLFGIGKLIFGDPIAIAWLALAAICLAIILRNLGRIVRPTKDT
jgi:solute:Na+ symporter, SSS family